MLKSFKTSVWVPIMRRARLTLCIWSCLVFAAFAQSSLPMTDTQIGPVRAGMLLSEFRALGIAFAAREVNVEGENLTEYTINVASDAQIDALVMDGRLVDVGTRSPKFATARGAKVGSTLEELQRLYPEGRFHIGIEGDVGRFLSFATRDGAPGGFFYFDADVLPESCFAPQPNCPMLLSQRAISYRTTFLDPMTSLGDRSIGPISLGMTRAEVEALGMPIRRNRQSYLVFVAEGREVRVVFQGDRVWRLATASRDFSAYRGGRVGATLEEMRSYYPEGRVLREGVLLSFIIAPGRVFLFDTREPTNSCMRWGGQPCPEFDQTHAFEYSVTNN